MNQPTLNSTDATCTKENLRHAQQLKEGLPVYSFCCSTMRILIIGANGLVGSAATARLTAEGHEILAAGRRSREPSLLEARWTRIDVARTTEPQNWVSLLTGIDAVLYCAGTLQDGPADSTSGVHAAGLSALVQACETSGVRKLVHLSAIGVDRATPTAFSQTKLVGDRALMDSSLDWVILRPSVIIGRPAYGGSALIRGLSSLSVLPVMPQTAALQIVHLNDVLDAISFFLQPGAPAKRTVELVGPHRYSFEDVVGIFRRWMRWEEARRFHCPGWLASLTYRLGDAVSILGWRPPIRTTAALEMVRGATGDSSEFRRLLRKEPRDVREELAAEPASVQERWFARLYLLKPLVFGMFALFWIATGIISLGPGWRRGVELVMEGGTSDMVARLAVLSGGLADILIGFLIAFRRTARFGLYAAFGISVAYALIGTILVPWMWFDPLGPMLKIGPIMVFNLVALAILDDR
jgi:uncharacterized protein YbjT (DUF2867 family)